MSAKPWAEPGVGVEERAERVRIELEHAQDAPTWPVIAQALLAAYLDGVKAAAKACEDLADRLPDGCADQSQARYYASHVRSVTPRAPAAALKADAP